MASEHGSTVLRSIHTLFSAGTAAGLSDAELIERIRAGSGVGAAFEALLERHGGMVWNVCRTVLRDSHDAEDAFQASFLVLLRKAGSIRKQNALAPWLYGVAYRIAVRAKTQARRRGLHEAAGVEWAADGSSETASSEELSLLHEEVNRLPEKYRTPVVLCYLEGRTNDDVARQLGWPVGTVSGRLARAKILLRSRLSKRGLAPSAGLFAAALASRSVRAAAPGSLVRKTVESFLAVRGHGTLATASVAGSVAALANGAFQTLLVVHAKWAASLLLAGVTVAAGVGMNGQDANAGPAALAQTEDNSKKKPQNSATPLKSEVLAPAVVPSDESPLMELAREELAALETQVKRRKAGVEKARAEVHLATAILARSKKLQARAANFVTEGEIQKYEADVNVGNFALEIADAELAEAELRLKQAKRIISHPEWVGDWIANTVRSNSIKPLEMRLENVERKLDQILKALEKPNGNSPL